MLLAQALAVRRSARQLPEPPGPRQGRAGAGHPLRLLIVGDSSAAGVGAATQDKALSGQLVRQLARRFEVDWRLEAATGATTADTIRRIEALAHEPFDVVVTAVGVNDVTRAVPTKRWVAQQRALIGLIRGKLNAKHILMTGVPPMGQFPLLPNPLRWVLGQQANRLDTHLAGITATVPQASHIRVDFNLDPRFAAADGYHPSEDAYALWAGTLAHHIPNP